MDFLGRQEKYFARWETIAPPAGGRVLSFAFMPVRLVVAGCRVAAQENLNRF